MKNKILFIILIATMVFISACSDPQKPTKPTETDTPKEQNEGNEEKLKLGEYYPIKENVRYVYEGSGNEFAGYDVYIDYIKANKVQRRVNNGGTVVAEVIEIKDGEIVKLLSRSEAYYREDLLREDMLDSQKDSEVLLKEPLEKGNSWQLADNRKRTITNVDAKVEFLGNEHKAIEVTTEGLDSSKTMDYYVKDIGLVKSLFTSEDAEIYSTLKEIEEDVVFTQNIKFFYPDINDEKLHNKDIEINFKTNNISRTLLEKAYKEALKGTDSVVLTKNTKINYLYLNSDGMVYIDLSKEFSTEMNAGSGYESMILDSLATSFGNYYGVDKVVLTIDGGNYESGHIILEKGDYLKVDKNALLTD